MEHPLPHLLQLQQNRHPGYAYAHSGRKVAKEYSVEDPTVEEVSRAVGMCKIKNIIEPHKAYSRDFLERGRLKVEVFDKDGKPVNALIPSSRR